LVVVVTRATQALLLTVTGAVLIRMAAGDTYLRYVNTWMRWPLIACGVLLFMLSLSDLLRSADAQTGEEPEASHVPRAAWLLFLPSLVVFLIAPPALGAHFAERAQSTVVPAEPVSDAAIPPLPATDPAPVLLEELIVRAAYDGGATLLGRRLELTGFVSRDRTGDWYVTQFGINCCAADATVTRVIATGAAAPPDDQWVKVVGTYVEGTGAGGATPPEVSVEQVTFVEAPRNQYR
jgi:uncharacterized repeat protein (TIGR03943 family)